MSDETLSPEEKQARDLARQWADLSVVELRNILIVVLTLIYDKLRENRVRSHQAALDYIKAAVDHILHGMKWW